MASDWGKGNVSVGPQTPTENAVGIQGLKLAKLQVQAAQRSDEIQKLLFEKFPGLLASAMSSGSLDENQFNLKSLTDEINTARSEIESAASHALKLGESDISNFVRLGLENVRDVLAPDRGFRPGDSPILGLGSDIVEEGLRQQGQLVRGIRGQEATQLADIPYARGFANTQLRAQLSQQAFNNRLQLAGAVGGFGLNYQPNGNIPSLVSVLQAPRLRGARTTTASGGFDVSGSSYSSTGAVTSSDGASTSSTSSGSGGGAIASLFSSCWVAAEFYGWHTPEWWNARNWIVDGWQGEFADAFRAFYLRHGEWWAKQVRENRVVRFLTRPIFVWAERKGRDLRGE